MILGLVLLPMVMALVVLLLRGLPLTATLLTTATLVALAVISLMPAFAAPLIILGRSVSLSSSQALGLAYCSILLAVVILHDFYTARNIPQYALVLVAMGLAGAALIVDNNAIATLTYEMGAIAAIMLVASRERASAMTGLRTLTIMMLSSLLVLIASWALEQRAASPENATLATVAGLTLTLGFALQLAIVPFHVWILPLYRQGKPLAITTLGVVYVVVALLRLHSLFQTSMWPDGSEFFGALLFGGGIITYLGGCVMAAPQRSYSGVLGYAALADFGLVLMGVAAGTELAAAQATLHLAYRSLGIVAMSLGIATIRHLRSNDSIESIRGAFWQAPMSFVGIIVGGLSLAGFPGTAGYTTRLPLYESLTTYHSSLLIAMVICGLGPLWGFMRCFAAALSPSLEPTDQREPWFAGAFAGLCGLALGILGVLPSLLDTARPELTSALYGFFSFFAH